MPPPDGVWSTRSWQDCVPAPQVPEHAPHWSYLNRQSCFGQAGKFCPHACVRNSDGHAAPPFLAAVTTCRAHMRVPPVPHVTLQAEQLPQADT